MNKNSLLTWLVASMVLFGVGLLYCNLTGKRILGSSVEKWEPKDKHNHK